MATRCVRCGAEKPAGRGRRLCENCLPVNAPRPTCSRCGGPKPREKGRRLCDACRAAGRPAWTGERMPCSRCGAPKPPGAGRTLCENCPPVKAPKPCVKCGGPKGGGRRTKYCADCQELVAWEVERKHKAREQLKRAPCKGCGRKKPTGRGYQYCEACRRARTGPKMCNRCGERPIRGPRARFCLQCKLEAREAERAYHSEYGKRRRRSPEFVEAERERKRISDRERRRTDAEYRERRNEAKRIWRRLNAERKGRPLRLVEGRRGGLAHDPSVPGHALVQAIERVHRELADRNPFDTLPMSPSDNLAGINQSFWEWLGINERTYRAWKLGERDPAISVAESVLVKLGLAWWDVWTEETVRKPLLRAQSYRFETKRIRSGQRTRYRQRGRARCYGDVGPDHEALAAVAALFPEEALAA